jgi:hypothetical protein
VSYVIKQPIAGGTVKFLGVGVEIFDVGQVVIIYIEVNSVLVLFRGSEDGFHSGVGLHFENVNIDVKTSF